MARKRKTKPGPMVTFQLGDRTYQIDADQKKVYRRFVEIETSRAAEIISVWRASLIAA